MDPSSHRTQSPRIFVSHSHLDDEFGLHVVSDLRRALGEESAVWYDASGGLRGGDAWWRKIVAEITSRTVFIVILSPDSMESSWVNDEIDLAWAQKNARGMLILPILYRPCTIRADLTTRQIISFVPPVPYETGLKSLFEALGLPKLTATIPVLPPTLAGDTQPPVIGAEPPLPQRETSPATPPASAVVLAGEAADQARLPDVKVPTQRPQPVPAVAWQPVGTSGLPPASAAAFPRTVAQNRRRRGGLGQKNVMLVGMATILVATLFAGLGIYLHGHSGSQADGPGTSSTPPPAFGGTLTDGIRFDPDSLLPQGSVYADSAQVDEAIWAPLFYGDPNGRIQPALASGFDLSADGKTYTIHLRTGLTWSDGNALTADDVVFTINLLKDPNYGATGQFSLNDEIASATASDSVTVNITLTKVDPTFLGTALTDAFNFAPLPRRVFGSMSPATVLHSSDDSWPKVVSGPFTIQSRVMGHSITLVKNAHYYQAPQPYLQGITFTVASAAGALTGLQATMFTNSWNMPVSDLATLKNIAGYSTIVNQVPLGVEAMYLNETNPILADAKVRKALSISLDMKTLRDIVWNGLAGSVCDDGVGTFAYEAAATCYSYDVTQAKSLLDTDGWTMGSDGYRHKYGQTLELRYITPSNNTVLVRAGLFAQENWKQNIGLKLDMFNQAIGQLFQTITKSYQNYDIVAFTYTPNGYDPDNHTFWACNQLTTNNGFNISHYCNPTVDAGIKQELGTNDQQTRLNAFHTIYQQIVNDVPVIYFSTDPTISCATKKLKNYAPSSLVAGETWNVWDWYLTH